MSTTRRGAGEGSIYRRSDGRWSAQVSAGWDEKGRVRDTVYGKTRREVSEKLRALQDEAAGGLPHVDARTTVGVYLDGWLERIGPRLRPATRLRYAGLIKFQLAPHLGHLRLAKLSPADVAAMLAKLEQAGLSPRTASHARAVLRTALSDAEKWDLVVRNVAKLTDAPRVPKPSPKVLPVEEVQSILAAVDGTGIENLVTLALYSGMRMGELLGLRWSDVDLERHQLTISTALQRLQTETVLVEPKSERSRRALRLAGPALEALRAERRRQAEAQLAAGGRWRPIIEGLVFTSDLGAPLLGTNVTRRFQRALRAAGLAPLRFHHLRHLHGSLLLAGGTDIATVSALLGHASIALTASTYAGIMPALRQDAADRLERMLARPS